MPNAARRSSQSEMQRAGARLQYDLAPGEIGDRTTPDDLGLVVTRFKRDQEHEGPLRNPRRGSICDRKGHQGRIQETGTEIPSRPASGRQGGGSKVQGHIGCQRPAQGQGEAPALRCRRDRCERSGAAAGAVLSRLRRRSCLFIACGAGRICQQRGTGGVSGARVFRSGTSVARHDAGARPRCKLRASGQLP